MNKDRYFSDRPRRGRGGRGRGRGSSSGRSEQGSSGSGSWTRAESGARGGRDRPPPGLRGREIGLFYRDRAKERYQQRQENSEYIQDLSGECDYARNQVVKSKREFVMSLNLPAGVIRRVEKLLQNIYETRKDEVSIKTSFKHPGDYLKKRDPFDDPEGFIQDSPSSSRKGKYEHSENNNDVEVVTKGEKGAEEILANERAVTEMVIQEQVVTAMDTVTTKHPSQEKIMIVERVDTEKPIVVQDELVIPIVITTDEPIFVQAEEVIDIDVVTDIPITEFEEVVTPMDIIIDEPACKLQVANDKPIIIEKNKDVTSANVVIDKPVEGQQEAITLVELFNDDPIIELKKVVTSVDKVDEIDKPIAELQDSDMPVDLVTDVPIEKREEVVTDIQILTQDCLSINQINSAAPDLFNSSEHHSSMVWSFENEKSDEDCILLETGTPIVEVEDELESPGEIHEIDSDDDCYIYEPPIPSGPRLRPFYTEVVGPKHKTFPFGEPVPKKEIIEPQKSISMDFIPLNVTKTSPRSLIKVNKRRRPLHKRPKRQCTKALDKNKTTVNNKGPRWTYLEELECGNVPVKNELKMESLISVADLPQNQYRALPVKHEGQQYKYGYYDIITGSFMEKLEQCLNKECGINRTTPRLDQLSQDYYSDFLVKSNTTKYKQMLQFRERLPAPAKRSQVIVISGETGCGKSTQVPQIILDDAISSKRGAYVKVLVTQPRRIAASSLALRVSEERAEKLGESVGFVVRLEKVEARARGSITYCTTGVLLADLEVNQAMADVSHIILDEVHERDCNVDLAMCMLKQVISKRNDLKLILMSATLDAASLSAYFNDCPTVHIEGLAYPVTDVYMEDILKITGYKLPDKNDGHGRFYGRKKQADEDKKNMEYLRRVEPILKKRRYELGEQVYRTLLDRRIEDLNIDLIQSLLSYICKGDEGAVLVFVPGFADITKLLEEMRKSEQYPSDRYEIYPLHSKLSSEEQKKIFDRPPKGVRKIVIATNIAETSITIDDVVYVIDSAKIKITGLNVTDNISTLKVEWVSQANLRQRRGRAGRVQAGVCYHLITSFGAEALPTRLLPELQRSNLLEPVLTVKKLRLGKAAEALSAVPDPPAPEAVKWAVEHLKRLGGLDKEETLTPLGWHLARLPVHPAAGKLLLLAALFGCLDRAASVAAAWGFKDPFLMVIGKEKEADLAKSLLTVGEPSDHIAISEAVLRWETMGHRRKVFAREHFLSISTLSLLTEMKKQFAENLRAMGFLPSGNIKSPWENRNANNLSIFKAVIAAALYPQIGTVRWIGLHRPSHRIIVHTPEDGKVDIHPSSALAMPRPMHGQKRNEVGKRLCNNPGANWHVYWIKQKTSKLFLLDVTLVHTMPLLFFGELNISDDKENQSKCLIDISSIKVRCDKSAVHLLVQLRNLLDEVLASKVATPEGSIQHGDFEENVLNAVIELITAEDEQTNYMEYDTDESDRSESDTGFSY